MPPARAEAAPLALIWGDDDFAVQRRARQLFEEWSRASGGTDVEVIDARAGSSAEALRALSRLREALQTLPFFGVEKVIWFRDCSFLGEDRTAAAAAVTEALAALAQELKRFAWTGVRLLISAGRVDKRRVFYKTVEALGRVEELAGLSPDDRDWGERAEAFARQEITARGKRISDIALARLVAAVGPNLRQLAAEAEKLTLYVGDRTDLTPEDVTAVVARGKHARAFALADALGDRDLPRALRALDEELWEIRLKVDRDKSAIGLLYSLISKVRLLLLVKELVQLGHLRPGQDARQVRRALEQLPAELLPEDRRYNPAAQHPYVIAKALAQTAHYTTAELVAAMDLLLQCNLRLVARGLEEELVLQQALLQLIGPPRPRTVVAV